MNQNTNELFHAALLDRPFSSSLFAVSPPLSLSLSASARGLSAMRPYIKVIRGNGLNLCCAAAATATATAAVDDGEEEEEETAHFSPLLWTRPAGGWRAAVGRLRRLTSFPPKTIGEKRAL